MRYGRIRNRRRRGFTLVELLMVMMIIAILAALLMSGVNAAWISVGRARVLSELSQLETALNNYKADKGEYPPGLPGAYGAVATVNVTTRSNQLNAHMSRAFPRFINRVNFLNGTTFLVRNLGGTAAAPTYATRSLNLNTLDPAETYLFFLNGLPILQNNVPQGFDGFNADPVNPLVPAPDPSNTSSQVGRSRTRPLFDVDPKRLIDKDGDGFPEYLPADKSPAPIVYFVNGQYAASATAPYYFPNTTNFSNHSAYSTTFGYAVPYAARKPLAMNDSEAWKNPQGIQLITAGSDAKWGSTTVPTAFRLIPSALGLEDGDNLVNFHTSNLGSAQ